MRTSKRLVAFMAGLLGVILISGVPLWAEPQRTNHQPLDLRYESSLPVIPLEDQPFYPELVQRADLWRHTPLGQVVGNSPQETLLNFYAVMADVGLLIEDVETSHRNDPGLFWNRQARAEIEEVEVLFNAAVDALDGSSFPLGVRPYLKDEAAIQLKHVLDFILNSSRQIISIPDANAMKALNDERSKDTQSWTLPGSSIVLTSELADNPINSNFLFSAATVANVGAMYEQVEQQVEDLNDQEFFTRSFYQDFVHTPGRLFPPKWYLNLPAGVRARLETEVLFDQTLFRLALSIVAILLLLLLIGALARLLIRSYKPGANDAAQIWTRDSLAWTRVVLVLPMVVATKAVELFIDLYLNFTGTPLVVLTVLFEAAYFSLFVVLVFLFFEALGRSLSEGLVRLSGDQDIWQLSRTSNRVMPTCRIISGVVAVALIYKLLLQLGLSPTLVLALSTVPGLAIGLGASKLLSNLFAGLSLQTDRPLRVGEFCEIGDKQGFLTKIGLRSVEIATATGKVTIPNAVAEDCIVNNLSRNHAEPGSPQLQGLDLSLELDTKAPFSPDQMADLLALARSYAENRPDLINPCLTVELNPGSPQRLRCIALIHVVNWRDYIALQESLSLAFSQLIDRVDLSHFVLGVSYDSSDQQLAAIPGILRGIIQRTKGFELRACRLLDIAEFSYNFKCHLFCQTLSYKQFKDSIDVINRELLHELAAAEIVIPFPTAIEIQRDDG
ncbi:small-conductance mechanosensitive ion channel/ MscS family [Synechococcus sp. MEDNS5]|uniref:mechanosensitive ion channel family protein n=1 Tax=Synechococcus sp. MEDNS5 TaxID=1442554 RepID=UPI0016442347|nr:mechanosensitive ion channel domain-containing protein [Synechococcus sp. MEDNS5]QNJ05660.1 small-conductance mechanosensitive ion channel/ MscS family [Synechococcus sp. MEDNS5]